MSILCILDFCGMFVCIDWRLNIDRCVFYVCRFVGNSQVPAEVRRASLLVPADDNDGRDGDKTRAGKTKSSKNNQVPML